MLAYKCLFLRSFCHGCSIIIRCTFYHFLFNKTGNPLSDTPDPDTETLERGRHFFPFSFSLPEDTPCSYEGVEGWVRYYLQARLLLAGSAPHTVIRQHITVLKDLDLSSEKVQVNETKFEKNNIA